MGLVLWLVCGFLAGGLYLWIMKQLCLYQWTYLSDDIPLGAYFLAGMIAVFGPFGFVLALIPLMEKTKPWR